MGREFELKYSAEPRQLEKIALAYGDFQKISMETTYYDTLDGKLSRQRITLRRRMENGQAVCTVKTPQTGQCRGEWDVACADIQEAIPVLCKLGCDVDLIAMTATGVVEVCGARFTRLAKTVTWEDAQLEIALDQGVLLGGGREKPFWEVEVELKDGPESAAEGFAEALAREFGLKPEKISKFRRALNLARGE